MLHNGERSYKMYNIGVKLIWEKLGHVIWFNKPNGEMFMEIEVLFVCQWLILLFCITETVYTN